MPISQFPQLPAAQPVQKRPEVLASAALDPEYRLKHVLEAERRAKDEWDDCTYRADDIDPEDDPDGLEQARKDTRNAYRRWFEISEQAQSLAEEVRRRTLELPENDAYAAAFKEAYDPLVAQFDGGPHYRLLCERVAGLTVRLRQLESSGRDYAPSEHHQLNAQLLSYINQLQKYTEAMKSETISRESQAVAEAILGIVEHHIASSQPDLWLMVMRDVRSALESSSIRAA